MGKMFEYKRTHLKYKLQMRQTFRWDMKLFWLILNCSSWFSDPDQTVQSDRDNREPLTNTVLLTTRTVLCTKSMKPFEPQLNFLDLRTVNSSHGSDQRFKKKKKKLQAHSTLSPWLKLQPLWDSVKHWKYWDPIISISLALSLVCSLSKTFFLNLLLFLSLSCFPAATPSRCCVNWFNKTKER